MTKKLYFHLALAGIFLMIALVYEFSFIKNTKVETYADQINVYLAQQETEVEAFFADKAFINRQLQGTPYYDISLKKEDFNKLKKLAEKDYSITIHTNDSLVFWTNNNILPQTEDIVTIGPERIYEFKQLQNGYYELIGQSYKDSKVGDYTITALIPVRYNYDLESNYLPDNFKANEHIPSNIEIVNQGEHPIVSKSGKTLCYLESKEEIVDKDAIALNLFLYLLALFFTTLFFHRVGQHLIRTNKLWQGAAFFIISVFGLRALTYLFGMGAKFSAHSLFANNFDTVLSNSLGDLLINIALLFWVMAFFHGEFPVHSYEHLNRKTKFTVTTLNYLAIFGSILVLTAVFKTLVFSTSLNFDFNNIFDLGANSLLAITGLILLLIAMFLFSHRMMMTIKKIALNRYERLTGIGIAVLVCLPFLIAIDFAINPWYLMVLSFFFIMIFDVFIDTNAANFTWLLIWLVVLSAFPSVLLFKYNSQKDRIVRAAYAKELTNTKDVIAEQSLNDLKLKLSRNKLLEKSLRSTEGKVKLTDLHKKIDQVVIDDTYLFYNYSYQIFGYDENGAPIIEDQEVSKEKLDFKLEASDFTSSDQVKYWSNDRGKSAYLLSLELPLNNETVNNTVILEFERQRRVQSKVYTELLNDKPYKDLEHLNKYNYAVYKNNKRIDAEGDNYLNTLTLSNLPPEGEYVEQMFGKRSELIYSAPNNTVVIIGKETGDNFKKAISLFSYIFTNLLIFAVLFAGINYSRKILPETVNFFLSRKPSLKNRIQFSVIGMILVSFLFIGVVTVWFFNNQSNDYHEARQGRKTEQVEKGAHHEVDLVSKIARLFIEIDTTFIPTKENLYDLDMANALSGIHSIDVNMYDLNGELIASSEETIFNKGIISRQMPAPAFRALSQQGLSSYTQEQEKMGSLSYRSSYIPLKVKEKTIAFIGLPYYSQTGTLRSQVSVFMGTLINVYVFLLLIAGGLAIFVANSITRPIGVIGEKLKRFKLGSRNQPLDWKTQDEIGVLISEYNKMIHKLEDSADRLAQSEREGAWREMAKQVAHEIKNPLTPMKLSIQYLQHAFRSNPEDIEPLLKRVSNTLIEQIDNLAQIASEFSNFAKMPRAENQNINFNQLVLSVYDLFHDGNGEDLNISLDLAPETFTVYADKNHLIRVLNNLLKNAQQAIPEDRTGKIEISLFKQEDIVILKVKDNGSGIPDDKKDKVFVPNFTTKSSGTGLGLAISKNIIESVNGEIYFKTVVGEGTEFFVELPIIEVGQAELVEDFSN